jgi:hypothetical protein
MKLSFGVLVTLLLSSAAMAETPRIAGGGPAPAGAYPWIVALLDKNEPNTATAQECGASLIHPYWVMTAAHCVLGMKATDLQVVAGAQDLNATGLTRINVVEIVTHPKHTATTYDYDVALLLLEQPVTNIAPVEIVHDPGLVQTGVLATALGWGTESEEDFTGTPILEQVQVPVVDQALANDADHLDGQLTENMLAAGREEGGMDTCAGDSGGPLVIRGSSGQWVQAGIVSWGEGCGLPKKPGVYTRVSKMRPWIQSIVWPNFAAWEAAAGITANNGPDVDGDGATQWLEYALRRNPLSPAEVTGFPKVGTELTGGHLYPTVTVLRPAGGGDVTWGLQGTADFVTWTALNPTTQQIGNPVPVAGDPGAEQVTWRGLEGTSGRSYLRTVVKPGGNYVNPTRTLEFPGGVTHALHSMDTLDAGYRKRSYALTGLTTGQSVTLTLRSDAFDPVLRLLNADTGAVITVSASNSGGGNDEKIPFTPAAGIRYSAQVSTQTAGGTGEFTLALFRIPASLPTISSSQSRTGSLSTSDPPDSLYPDAIFYSDDYVFTQATALPVTVFMSSTAYHPAFSILNAETNQFVSSAEGVEDIAWAMQSFVPRPGVTYLFRPSSYLPEETGNYTLKTVPTPLVTVGSSTDGSLKSSDGLDNFYTPDYAVYADNYALSGAPAGVPLTLIATSDELYMTLRILDAATGDTVAWDDPDDTPEATLTFTPRAGHSYIIRVSEDSYETPGDYTLLVQ